MQDQFFCHGSVIETTNGLLADTKKGFVFAIPTVPNIRKKKQTLGELSHHYGIVQLLPSSQFSVTIIKGKDEKIN